AHERPDEAGRGALRCPRVRGVAAGGDGEELRRGGGPAECEDDGHDRYVADRGQLGEVPGGVEAEPETDGERAEEERRACQPERVQRGPHRPGTATRLRQPKP